MDGEGAEACTLGDLSWAQASEDMAWICSGGSKEQKDTERQEGPICPGFFEVSMLPQRATRRRRKRRRRRQRQLPPHKSPELTPQDKKGKDGKEQAEQAELLSYDCSGRCASGERLHIGVGLSLSSEDMLPVTGVAKLPSLQESTDVPAAAVGAVTAAGSSKEG